MADLSDIQAAQSVKLVGASGVGLEQTPIGNNGNRLLVDAQVNSAANTYLGLNQLYSASANISATAGGSDNPLMLIRNPIGSGKTIYIYRILAGTSVASVTVEFKFFGSPTVTANGTAIPVASRFINNGASASVMLANTSPTISSSGTLIQILEQGQNNNSTTALDDFSIGIAAGGSLLITGNPSSNNRAMGVSVIWAEV